MFNCKYGGHRTYRHNAIRDLTFEHARGGGAEVKPEVKNLIPDGSAKRPADIWVKDFYNGQDAALDVVVTNVASHPSLFDAYSSQSNLGSIAEKGYTAKIAKSHAVCVENGLLFHPIAFESTGGVASESLVTLKAFSRRICSSTSIDPKKFFHTLMKKISMALQKANAMFVIDRLSLASPNNILAFLMDNIR